MAPSVAAPASVRHGAETAKPQQDSSPTCPKTSPRKSTKKLFHVTFGTHKKQQKTMLWYGSETPELVRFRNTRTLAGHAKQNACQKTLSRHLWNPSKTMLWSGSETPEHQQVRFRNTRTPAGCEHTPRKTHAKKLFHVTFGTHKKQTLLWSGSETPMPKNSFTSPLEPIKNNKKQCFGTVPKHPNWSGSETPEH